MFIIACDPSSYKHNYDQLILSVTNVELVEYKDPLAKELFGKRDKVKSIDIEKIVVVETLREELREDFFEMLSDYLFLRVWRHQDSPNGFCIRLLFESGNFELLALDEDFSGIFDSEGNVEEFIGSGMRSIDISKYFEKQIA